MAKKPGVVAARGVWLDVQAERDREVARVFDPAPEIKRNGIAFGKWPGYPHDNLPPDCPISALGRDGAVDYFIDTLGQLISIDRSQWSDKVLLSLFAGVPNYVTWAWPRLNSEQAKIGNRIINGIEARQAYACLMKASAEKGIFSPADRVRGRGAWTTRTGDLLWHAGDRIYRVDAKGELKEAKPGEIDGIFYPQRPEITTPWRVKVETEASPAHDLLAGLRSWNWERPVLDPLLVVGWVGGAFLGGALDWRSHLYTTGDKGVGKSQLHRILRDLLGTTLLSTADTTPAGIYQRVKQDSLPVAIDELEASADNRRVMGVVSLARLASSGGMMFRGGAEHSGVEFQMRNVFFMSSINPPPLEPADKSRLAILNLGRLDPAKVSASPPTINVDVAGRMILRQLLDGWADVKDKLAYWKAALYQGGIDSRGQDTWGTLLAVANVLLGDEALEEAGLPIADPQRLGELIARETAQERSDAIENWVGCLHYMLGSRIEAWKGGEQPSVGSALEDYENGVLDAKAANDRLTLVGLKVIERRLDEAWSHEADGPDPWLEEMRRGGATKARLLAVPTQRSPGLDRLFEKSKWKEGVWGSALKQAPRDVVVRHLGNGQNVKINRQAVRCLLVDLDGYDRVMSAELGGPIAPDPTPPAPPPGGPQDDPFAVITTVGPAKGERKAKWPAKGEK